MIVFFQVDILLNFLIIYFIPLMRRPQSANHNRNYFAPVSRDEGELTVQQPHRVFVKAGKKTLFNPMTASNDLTRLLPKKIQHDKERLYCETLQLKTNLNEVSQENLRLKTKIATLQREKDRLNRTEETPLPKGKSSNFSNLNSKGEKENGMVSGLKKMIRQSREENESLLGEISKLKRGIRYTKINELQTQKQTIYEQNRRLAKVIQQLEGELGARVRQDEQLRHLQGEIEQRSLQLKEVTADNMKYEEILEDMELKNKEVTERLLVTERKWQRDISVEKRKIEQLNRQVDLLKHEVKILTDKLEEERKKVLPASKKLTRPVSSRPHQDLQSNKNRTKEKEEAMQKNRKLKEQLEQARQKLAESQNQLKVTADAGGKDKLGISKDQTFELVLTKNEANEFMKQDDSYTPDFDGSPKPSKSFNELPLEEKSKSKTRQSVDSKRISPILQEIREILTYRMKYTRYPFHELKADIESSPLRSFNYQDLINMLESQPFSLTTQYAQEFLKASFGKNRLTQDDQLDSKVLLRNLRTVIEDFELLDEEEEEQMLYRIAQLMTKHRSELQQAFKRVSNGQNCITKDQLTSVLLKYGEMSEQEINLAICYISINAQTLQAISYTDLLDRFYINSTKEFSNSKGRPRNHPNDELFSMGENEDLDEGELIAEDELV